MDATIETKSLAIFWPAPFPLLMLMQSSHSVNLTAFKSMNHLLSCITIESPLLPNFPKAIRIISSPLTQANIKET
jgi:hypothetical protein